MPFVCTLPLLGALFGACPPAAPVFAGYAEGDYVLAAPVDTAAVTRILALRGARIAAGQPLAVLEQGDAADALAQAQASLKTAEAQLADIRTGKRPEEIAVIEASLNASKAQADEAGATMRRNAALVLRGAVSQADYDSANAALKTATAMVAQNEASLAVARLAARPDQIAAAVSTVAAAQAAVDSARWRLDHRTLTAPVDVVVTDILRHPGEMAGPQAPVLQLLPVSGAVKLRVYVPEPWIAKVHPGSRLSVSCDGCSTGLAATVSFVDSGPQFTPPVIYSQESRQKLVYLVEAVPDAGSAAAIRPGQLVDVTLPGDTP